MASASSIFRTTARPPDAVGGLLLVPAEPDAEDHVVPIFRQGAQKLLAVLATCAALALAGTIGYEVLTSLGRRFIRAYRGEA